MSNRYDGAPRMPSREGKRHPADMLKGMLREQSQRVNEAVKAEGLEGALVSSDGALDPKGYAELHGDGVLEEDAAFVRERIRGFSGVTNPSIRAFYRDKHGTETEEQHIRQWQENNAREKNSRMEMAVTALLSQKLGAEFLVVRTAPYDDYKNGVDTLILDRVTGEVVGAFDEVHEGGDGSRTESKKAKVETIARKGGAKIRYGLALSQGALVRASLEGVPVFYLGLLSEQLEELEHGLAAGDARATDKTFATLVASLSAQHAELGKLGRGSVFAGRLASFGKSLARIRG